MQEYSLMVEKVCLNRMRPAYLTDKCMLERLSAGSQSILMAVAQETLRIS